MFTKNPHATNLLALLILSTPACREKSPTTKPNPPQPSTTQPTIIPKGDGSEENPVRLDQDLTPPPEPIPDYNPHQEPSVPDTPEPKINPAKNTHP